MTRMKCYKYAKVGLQKVIPPNVVILNTIRRFESLYHFNVVYSRFVVEKKCCCHKLCTRVADTEPFLGKENLYVILCLKIWCTCIPAKLVKLNLA